jgi:hypothetical protein
MITDFAPNALQDQSEQIEEMPKPDQQEVEVDLAIDRMDQMITSQ